MVNVMKAAKATGFAERIPIFTFTRPPSSTPWRLWARRRPKRKVIRTSNYHFYYPDNPKNKAFVKAFKDAYKREPRVGALYGYVAAYFIHQGLIKAGKVMDRGKIIDALEGMKVDTPVGELEMRAFDHQLMLPMFMGVTKKVPEYPFLIASDIITIPAKDVMPSIEEIKKLRGKIGAFSSGIPAKHRPGRDSLAVARGSQPGHDFVHDLRRVEFCPRAWFRISPTGPCT